MHMKCESQLTSYGRFFVEYNGRILEPFFDNFSPIWQIDCDHLKVYFVDWIYNGRSLLRSSQFFL